LPSLASKHQWPKVDPGFMLHPSVMKRATGRPRKTRIRSSVEGLGGLGPRKRRCKRCGGTGHIAKNCKNAVDPSFGEDLVVVPSSLGLQDVPSHVELEVGPSSVDMQIVPSHVELEVGPSSVDMQDGPSRYVHSRSC